MIRCWHRWLFFLALSMAERCEEDSSLLQTRSDGALQSGQRPCEADLNAINGEGWWMVDVTVFPLGDSTWHTSFGNVGKNRPKPQNSTIVNECYIEIHGDLNALSFTSLSCKGFSCSGVQVELTQDLHCTSDSTNPPATCGHGNFSFVADQMRREHVVKCGGSACYAADFSFVSSNIRFTCDSNGFDSSGACNRSSIALLESKTCLDLICGENDCKGEGLDQIRVRITDPETSKCYYQGPEHRRPSMCTATKSHQCPTTSRARPCCKDAEETDCAECCTIRSLGSGFIQAIARERAMGTDTITATPTTTMYTSITQILLRTTSSTSAATTITQIQLTTTTSTAPPTTAAPTPRRERRAKRRAQRRQQRQARRR
ncbi:unnamed protein product [Durusdinium trenchii]|uniref:SRCR domain-containing protein n=1 Tax=Durusdinium trenchii TaxID=1381693 RepID=A0ABP0QCJ9_9DINO